MVACGTNPVNQSGCEIQENTEEAVREIKKPDSYYLVKCPAIPELKSDDLGEFVDATRKLMIQYGDMCKRHDGLVDQVK